MEQDATELLNTSSTYTPDASQYHVIDSDEERARREYAGNYTQSLVENAYKKYNAEQEASSSGVVVSDTTTAATTAEPIRISSMTTTILESESPAEDQTKLNRLALSDRNSQISDELIYLLDASTARPPSTVMNSSLAGTFETKTFTFRKEPRADDSSVSSGVRQPTLAQIIESFRSGSTKTVVGDCVEPAAPDMSHYPFAAPFALGIKLAARTNPLDIGSHIVSHVDAGSPADKAGLRPGSQLIRINEVAIEDKTHEFVLFFLNYLLRKNSCDLIELTVKEPVNTRSQAQFADTLETSLSDATSIVETSEMTVTAAAVDAAVLAASRPSESGFKSTSAISYQSPGQDDAYLSMSVSTPAIYPLASTHSSSSSFIAPPANTGSHNHLSLNNLDKNTQLFSQSQSIPCPQSTTLPTALTSSSAIITSTLTSPSTSSHPPPTLNLYPTAAAATTTTTTTGIENLKSIIAQITQINRCEDTAMSTYDALRSATALTTAFKPPVPDEEYAYETSIKIGQYQAQSQSQPEPQVQAKVEPAQQPADNLKFIFTEAINSNYDDYMKIRGISSYSSI